MPLTDFQRRVLGGIGRTRAPDSYLAGGTALHFSPNSTRYRYDVDVFPDSLERVAETFETDRKALRADGYEVSVLLSQPGFIRAEIHRGGEGTRVDWAHDSSWRFMPVVQDDLGGYLLHPVDLATHKVLALAGRDEVRDFVDIMFVMHRILDLGPLVWASVAKDPGFTPHSLLEQLRRRGRISPGELSRLHLARPVDLVAAKTRWLAALEGADRFVASRPPDEIGCLYYSPDHDGFVAPGPGDLEDQGLIPHYGRPGGILPRPSDQPIDDGSPREREGGSRA